MSVCAQCNEKADLKCSSCGLVYYCGKEHQKVHWKAHKNECVAYKIETNEQLGRYLVANRDIKAGSVIMKKMPLVAGPKMVTMPICLGCHKKLSADCVRCTICKWGVCGRQCETSVWHRNECALLASATFPPPQLDVTQKTSTYAVIMPLRAMLLKSTQKKHFDELMSLQSHIENNLAKPIYDYLSKSIIPLLKRINIPMASAIDPLQICSIFDTNAFEVRNECVNIRAVYPLVSFLSHNCVPNTRHLCDADFGMSVIATRDIEKGEPICTTYTQTLWPTLLRRNHLKRVKHFDCVCARCSDPTEMQTFVGSLKCQTCGDGLLLSMDPLDNDAHWECIKCHHQVGAYQIETMNAQIRTEILNAERTINDFEAMFTNYTHLLHAHNTHTLQIKYALVQLYESANCTRGINEEHLKRRVELCQELLKVSRIFEPGCSSFNETLENSIRSAETMLRACRERNEPNGHS